MSKRLIQLTHRTFLAVAATVVLGLVAAGLLRGEAALAAYPGANGKIAFESNDGVNWEIVVMEPDGSARTNVSAGRDPVWSPNGAKIAFVKQGEGHLNIWVMYADGSGQKNLTKGPAGSVQNPRPGPNGKFGVDPNWSPTGSRIAYSVSGEIFVMKANGNGKKNLTCTNDGQFQEAEPAYSPDGSAIAYRYNSADVANDIWVMNSDGTNRRPLTSTPVRESFPDWSPDGTEIVYMRSQPAGSIWKMNADGSGQTMLIGSVGETGRDPVWSPDGTKIVFASNAFDAHNGYDIFVMNPDGTGVTRVPSPEPPFSDLQPSWQPLGS